MKGRILFVSPGYFRGDDAPHMRRDGFRFVEALNRHGVEARLLLLSEPGCTAEPKDPRLAAAPYERWIDAGFWRAWQVSTVFVYAYGMLSPVRIVPVFSAIRAAGHRLVFQMDAGLGLPAFPYRSWTIFKRRYWWARWRNRGPLHSTIRAMAQTVNWAMGRSARFTCHHVLPLVDEIRVESPVALQNTVSRLHSLGESETAKRIRFAPHPVLDTFGWNASAVPKEKRILAVANNWRNPLKGGRILGCAFDQALSGTEWTATVIGEYSEFVAYHAPHVTGRIECFPRLPSAAVSGRYLASKILATASGAETGPIVAWEGLAAGASVVFPPELAQLEPLVEWGAATESRHRTARHLAEALREEMQAWDEDRRSPDRIAADIGSKGLVSSLLADLTTD